MVTSCLVVAVGLALTSPPSGAGGRAAGVAGEAKIALEGALSLPHPCLLLTKTRLTIVLWLPSNSTMTTETSFLKDTGIVSI